MIKINILIIIIELVFKIIILKINYMLINILDKAYIIKKMLINTLDKVYIIKKILSNLLKILILIIINKILKIIIDLAFKVTINKINKHMGIILEIMV